MPHLILSVLSVIGIAKCVRWMFETGRIDYLVILFWLILNLYNLIMSVFFIWGRKAVRGCERQIAEIPCKVHTKYEVFAGKTRDISESGVAIRLEKPFDVAEEEICGIELENERYHAEVRMKIVSVTKEEKDWRYVFSMTDFGNSKAEYEQLVYDRVPSLPVRIDESISNFDDLRINISRRMHTAEMQNRKKARIPIGGAYQTLQGEKVEIIDFNYQYMRIRAAQKLKEPCRIELEKGLELHIRQVRQLENDMALYQVVNYETIYNDKNSYIKLEHYLWDILKEEKDGGNQETKPLSLKRRRMLAEDEFAELDYL